MDCCARFRGKNELLRNGVEQPTREGEDEA